MLNKIVAAVWKYFDVIMFLLAMLAACVGSWLISPKLFCFVLAACLAVVGYGSELVEKSRRERG